MKKYLLVYIATLMSFTKPNQELIDRIGVKGSLTFNSTTFKFTWSQQNNNYYIQEYLPDGENADHFNQMLSIFLLAENIKTKDAVLQKISELKTRKKTDPTRNYILNQSPDGKEYMIDFVLGESKNDKMEVEEFNIYRYTQIDLANNKKGILVYANAKRAYGDDITPFFINLKTDRENLLNSMIATEMPSVVIGDK